MPTGRSSPETMPHRTRRPIRHPQSGVAAIELAVSMLLLMMFFFAVVSYGALFWAQQKLSHMVNEGARFALAASYRGVPPESAAAELACAHLRSLAARDALIRSMGGTPSCSPDTAAQAACAASGFECAALRLSIDVKGWPLLNAMRALARVFTDGSLLPDTLRARSIVQIARGSAPP